MTITINTPEEKGVYVLDGNYTLIADREYDALLQRLTDAEDDATDNPVEDDDSTPEPPKEDDGRAPALEQKGRGKLIYRLEDEGWKYSPVTARPREALAATMPWKNHKGKRALHAALTTDPIHTNFNSWRVEITGGIDRKYCTTGKKFLYETQFLFPRTLRFGTGNLGWFTFTQFHDTKIVFPDGTSRSGSPCFSMSALPNGRVGIVHRWGINKIGDRHKVQKTIVPNAYKVDEWSHLLVAGQYGKDGYIRVYVNGKKYYEGKELGYALCSGWYPKQGIYNTMPGSQRAAEQRKYRDQNISLEVMVAESRCWEVR